MAHYLEIDFNKVAGYKKLSEPAKRIFESVYKAHNSQQGAEYKKYWVPVKVKEYKTHLIVHFANGEWQHYAPNGTWY